MNTFFLRYVIFLIILANIRLVVGGQYDAVKLLELCHWCKGHEVPDHCHHCFRWRLCRCFHEQRYDGSGE